MLHRMSKNDLLLAFVVSSSHLKVDGEQRCCMRCRRIRPRVVILHEKEREIVREREGELANRRH